MAGNKNENGEQSRRRSLICETAVRDYIKLLSHERGRKTPQIPKATIREIERGLSEIIRHAVHINGSRPSLRPQAVIMGKTKL